MKTRCGILVAALFGASAVRRKRSSGVKHDCYSAFDGQPLLRYLSSSEEDMMTFVNSVEELGCVEAGNMRRNMALAICSTAQAAEVLKLYGNKVEVVKTDAGAHYRNSSGVAHGFVEPPGAASDGLSSDFYSDWRTFDVRTARVAAAVQNSGGIATLSQIGSSVEGRPIMMVRFRGAGWTSGDPRVVVSCELHAREWITGMACVYAVEKAVQKAQADPTWLDGLELAIIPLANPDGTIYSETDNRMWRKNRADNDGNRCKGVDLNRNWGPDWAGRHSTSGSKCSDTYYGSSAFSEPETQAVKRMVDEAPVTIHLDVHSFGNLILAPYSYTYDIHPKRAELDVPGLMMKDAVQAKHGESYTYGGNEVLYAASGVCPDYASSKGAYGYTYELRPGSMWGGGFAPGRDQILPASEEFFEGMLAAISWSKNPRTTAAPPTDPPSCPWHGCIFSCTWEEDCKYCDRCQ